MISAPFWIPTPTLEQRTTPAQGSLKRYILRLYLPPYRAITLRSSVLLSRRLFSPLFISSSSSSSSFSSRPGETPHHRRTISEPRDLGLVIPAAISPTLFCLLIVLIILLHGCRASTPAPAGKEMVAWCFFVRRTTRGAEMEREVMSKRFTSCYYYDGVVIGAGRRRVTHSLIRWAAGVGGSALTLVSSTRTH